MSQVSKAPEMQGSKKGNGLDPSNPFEFGKEV
jgi:hypothetical protein